MQFVRYDISPPRTLSFLLNPLASSSCFLILHTMRKRGRRSRLLLCLWPVSVDDEHRPMKKLKIPTDPNGEEDGDVFDAEIAKEKHQHRFPGALKSVMSDLFAVSTYLSLNN